MEFESKDQEIKFRRLENKLLTAQLELFQASKEFNEFKEKINYEK